MSSIQERDTIRLRFSARLHSVAEPKIIPTALAARLLLYVIGLYAGVAWPLVLRQMGGGANEEGGSIFNQLLWIVLGALSVGLLLTKHKPAALSRITRSHAFLLVLLFWFMLSTVWSLAPDATIRRVALQLIIIASVTSCVVAISNARVLCDDVLYFFAIATIVNWLALVALPPTPIGYAGIYLSKNNFGAFAALMVLFALPRIFAPSIKIQAVAGFVLASAIVFLVVSKAKTSMGLAVVVPGLALAMLVASKLSRINVALLSAIFLLSVAVTVGVIIEIIGVSTDDFLTAVFGDPTFTNRTAIWDFAGKFIAARPWQGHGFGGFWQIGDASPVLHSGAAWMTGAINQAHNLYVDLMLQGGYIALTLFLLQLALTISDSSRLDGWRLSDKVTVLGVIYYSALYNFFDTTLFRSFNSAWIYFIIASMLIALGSYAGEAAGKTQPTNPARDAAPVGTRRR
jgi:O-antigen ligase